MPRGPKYTYNPTFPIHTETSLNFVWISAAEAIQPSRTHIQKSFSQKKSSGNQTTNSRLKFLPGIPVLKLAFSLHPSLLYLCGHVFVSKRQSYRYIPTSKANIKSDPVFVMQKTRWTIYSSFLVRSSPFSFVWGHFDFALTANTQPVDPRACLLLTKKLARPVYTDKD